MECEAVRSRLIGAVAGDELFGNKAVSSCRSSPPPVLGRLPDVCRVLKSVFRGFVPAWRVAKRPSESPSVPGRIDQAHLTTLQGWLRNHFLRGMNIETAGEIWYVFEKSRSLSAIPTRPRESM
jgi:hypothetical protein